MPTNTSGGTTTSLTNTPQATDDSYCATEDSVYYWDVMADDLGGNAKILWSIDDGNPDGSTITSADGTSTTTTASDGTLDLTVRDVCGVTELSKLGASISIVNGQIKYDTNALDWLPAGQTTTDAFTYAIRLSNGTLSWATVTVTLTGTNDAPVAHPDIATTSENASVAVDVLANDTDVDQNHVLSLVSVTAPDHKGTASIVDGKVQFDPGTDFDHLAAGATETVVVTYVMQDEHGAQSTSTVTIMVTGTNDAPVAVADTGATTENALVSVDVLANDTDVDDGHTLTLLNASSVKGTASVVDGQVQFDPGTDFDHLAAGATESVVVTYVMQDEHGAQSTSTVTITVTGTNDNATITVDPTVTVDSSVTEAGGAENATPGDPDASGKLLVSDVDDGEAHFRAPDSLNGTYGTFTFDAATGAWTYTLDQSKADALTDGQHETDTLTVTSADGTDSHEIVVNITGANDNATITVDATAPLDSSVTEAGGVANGTPGDPDASGKLLVSDVDSGEAHFATPDSLDGTYGTFSFDAATGAWSYALDQAKADSLIASEHVTDTLTVTSADGTATQKIVVDITGANDAPTVDSALTYDAHEGDASHMLDLLAGASDVDHGETASLTITNVSYVVDDGASSATAPAGVSVSGSSLTVDAANAAFDHLAAGDTTTIVVSYDVTDAKGATVPQTETITITGTNDAPIVSSAIADQHVNEDTAWTFTVPSGWFTDVDDGTTLSYSATLGDGAALPTWLHFDAGTQTFSGTPPQDFNGTVSLSVTASDGTLSASDTFDLVVDPVNDAPVAMPITLSAIWEDSGTHLITQADLLGGSSDVDSSALTVTSLSLTSANGTLVDNGDGTWSYTPGANDDTSVSFSYTVSDGSLSASSTATMDLTPANDDPVLTGAKAVLPNGTEDTPYTFTDADLLAGYTDIDGGDLRVSSLTAVNGHLDYDFDTGVWTFTPNANFNGTVNLTYSVVDGHGGIAAGSNSFTITAVNDAAIIGTVDTGEVTEDSATNTATGQLTVYDVDAGESTFQAVSNVAGTYGTFGMTTSGAWTYTLNNSDSDTNALAAGATVTETFTIHSADGTPHDVVVTVNGANDAPTLAPVVSGSVDEVLYSTQTTDLGLSGMLGGQDPDTGHVLTYGIAGGTDNGNETVSYIGTYGTLTVDTLTVAYSYAKNSAAIEALNTGQSGIDTFTISLVDDHNATAFETYTVNITGADDSAPRFAPTDIQLTPLSNPSGDVALNTYDFVGTLTATDPDQGAISFSIDSQFSANGSPSSNFSIVGNTLSGQNIGVNANFAVTINAIQDGDSAALVKQETFHILTGTNGQSGDTINAVSGDDYLYGNAGKDMLFGLEGNDWLYGQSDDDKLDGGDGNDHLFGGDGNDTLTGVAGNDVFVFQANAGNDRIVDFTQGSDIIDLTALDASSAPGDQDFIWGGTHATANGVWYSYNAATNTTTIFADTNGSVGSAEFTLVLSGFDANAHPLQHTDFLGLL